MHPVQIFWVLMIGKRYVRYYDKEFPIVTRQVEFAQRTTEGQARFRKRQLDKWSKKPVSIVKFIVEVIA